ncbi:kinase domain protein [Dictyocaulus viviparus]|uniref:non-specific serine/threonine protein kinase n=1 Tax=Dictyocaulus viviparus TaxID=29172 RepID=A0A0D8XLH3_DICVI|nr:kinase domain protein [Dictyocaulus viviparus]
MGFVFVALNVLTPSSRNDILGSGENPQGATSPQQTLFSTLYVGESPFGLFAMDVMVDKHTITYAPKYLGPPLLEGPSPIALSDSEKSTFIPSSRTVITIDVSSITHKTTDGEFLLLGYHEKPTIDMEAIAPVRFTNSPLFTYIDYKPKEENTEEVPTFAEMFGSRLSEVVLRFYLRNPSAFYLVIFTLFSLLLTVLWLRNIQSNFTSPNNNIRNAKTFRHGTVDWEPINNTKKMLNALTSLSMTCYQIPDGWINVGKLLYNPSEILGRGCEGTVVYKGKFDGRDVAVKRVISEFVKLVDQEADLLRESDAHPNVIRYFCMESDSQFRYLALELCLASLNDYVHDEGVRRKISILPIELLRQAAEGLAHLHVKQIVHRDMKPHNVLLSVTGSNQVRAVISDFGLCKRVLPGRQSFSKRSGLAGTDGWIAPEMLTSESTSYPVDVFSLGCIFYYVLSNGHHPFGECLHRQTNIVSGHYVLRGLSEDIPVSISLIENMIQRAPELRPSLKRVLAHPFFWNAGRRLQFFGDVSDRVEKEENSSIIVRRLEGNARNVVGANWRSNICDCLAADLRKFRSYKGNSVKDLLRAMRNKKHHYRELPENVRNSLGCIPNQFVLYFTTRFPLLLLHTYEAMEWCADEDVFKSYYSDEVTDEVRSRMEQIKNGD